MGCQHLGSSGEVFEDAMEQKAASLSEGGVECGLTFNQSHTKVNG